jgi:hypothetical protein
MSLDKQLIDICRILNNQSVRYLIVGGTAVSFHGYARSTTNTAGVPTEKPDYDFWFQRDYGNYYNLLNCIELLGIDVSREREEKGVDLKKAFLRIPHPEFTADFYLN